MNLRTGLKNSLKPVLVTLVPPITSVVVVGVFFSCAKQPANFYFYFLACGEKCNGGSDYNTDTDRHIDSAVSNSEIVALSQLDSLPSLIAHTMLSAWL